MLILNEMVILTGLDKYIFFQIVRVTLVTLFFNYVLIFSYKVTNFFFFNPVCLQSPNHPQSTGSTIGTSNCFLSSGAAISSDKRPRSSFAFGVAASCSSIVS